MESLAKEQDKIGFEIERLVTNYRKDGPARRTVLYLNRRLNELNELWESFSAGHQQLLKYAEAAADHPYFARNYFSVIQQEYMTAKDSIASVLNETERGEAAKLVPGGEEGVVRSDKEQTALPSKKGIDDNLEGLRNQLAATISSIEYMMDGIRGSSPTQPKIYYDLKSNTLSRYWEELREVHRAICRAHGGDVICRQSDINKLEERIQDTLIFLATCKEDTGTVPHTVAPSQPQVKLPEMSIPRFDGDYARWTSFHDLFHQIVDSQHLGDAQKMWYLKTSLVGEAERLIKHMPISAENYADAWVILRNRYDNRRLMVSTILDRLLSQPAIVNESARSIKSCHDTIKECVLGLKSIKIDTTHWDPILLHILIKKLDKTSHNLFEQSLKTPRELQSLDSFLTFLELRFQALEALGSEKPISNKIQPKKVSALVSTNKATVELCKNCNGSHKIFACENFKKLSILERIQKAKQLNLCLNCLRTGHKSAECSSRACLKCHKRHNTLLHREKDHEATAVKSATSKVEIEPKEKAVLSTEAMRSEVLLSTVVIQIPNNNGQMIDLRAILDSGSQVNLITEAALKKLNLKAQPTNILISSIGGITQKATRRLNLPIHSKKTNFKIEMNAYVVHQITTQQPSETFKIEDWPIPRNITLADPSFSQAKPVDILIGIECYYQLLSIGQIRLGDDLPVLQNTVLGWVVGGRYDTLRNVTRSIKTATCGMFRTEGVKLDEKLEKFWRLEECETPTVKMTSKEQQCEAHFKQHSKRAEDGRFIVRLPFASDPMELGQTKTIAIQRFYQLEKRLAKDTEVHRAYREFMEEYIRLGHMTEVEFPNLSRPHFILPHHCVLKPDSSTTKLRVVFDASVKSTTNISLNDVLHTGPTIQDELFTILLRFRLFKYVVSADIEKMYRQIWIDKEDRPYQMIFWRDDATKQLRCYQLNTVTYGTTVAPYLATKCLEQLAVTSKLKYPIGSQAIQKDFYMDDLLTGANSLPEALQKKEEVQHILISAGFKLRKWCSNHSSIIKDIDPADREVQYTLRDNTVDQVKTLGVIWIPTQDELIIRVPIQDHQSRVTKRLALSTIAHIFDPLGLLSPVTIAAKIFIQSLWKLKLDWDAALPMEHHTTWTRFQESLEQLNEIKIPRHVFGGRVPRETQLHAFADASERAYAVAVYLRATHYDGTITVQLICAKTRVAPIKTITIPRLELCAAKLAVGLVHRLQTDLAMPESSCFFWTDSVVVLHWIHSDAASYQTFVANRIAAIQQYSTPQQWRHVSSQLNPADQASRGISPARLRENVLWFYGPLFLHGNPDLWPAAHVTKKIELERKKNKSIFMVKEVEPSIIYQINHRNSFRNLLSIMALVIRFTKIARRKSSKSQENLSTTVSELDAARIIIIKEVQKEEFREEIKSLQATKQLSPSNRISNLTPFIDHDGLLRVGGRLKQSDIEYSQKHPVLLPYGHPITKLILTQIHNDHQHAGPQALLAIARQRYWPIKGKTLARSIVLNCVRCARARPKLFKQLMGDLPANRVQQARPFLISGVDFAGPLFTHFKRRGKQPQKTYLAVFCCFATKAVHLELTTELTTEAFIGTLKRFMARRGNCRDIFCDNATNFVGANNQLLVLKQMLQDKHSQESINKFCTGRGTDFHFIPPRAPHFGGLWEAAVKSAKHIIVRNLTNANLTYEELETVVVEAEGILNSRPLTPLSSDPNDLQALTPGHFLIGEPITNTVDVHANVPRLSLGQRWRMVMELKYKIWQRWSTEYLNELQHRYKWKQTYKNATPGMMVVLKEDNVPVLRWPLGRIINTIPGKDGLVRVADVKTATGTLRRPIHKLAPLPVNNQSLADEEKHVEPTPSTHEVAEDRQYAPPANDTDKTNGNSSEPKKPRLGNLFLQILLLIGLCLPTSAKSIKIQPFENSPGLYVENLGPAHLVLNEWKLVVYYDLTSYTKELNVIKEEINQLIFLNQLIKREPACEGIIRSFQSFVKQAEKVNQLMERGTRDRSRRKKRGAFNIVGNMASALFGVLDAEYAEHMASVINRLDDSDHHMQGLIINQTMVINSTVNIMAQIQRHNEHRLNELEAALNRNIEAVHNRTQEANRQGAVQSFMLSATQLTLMMDNYQRIQDALWESFMDTNHGKLNSKLLTPEQLQAAIASIKENLPSNVRLPLPSGDVSGLYRIISVHGCSMSKNMMFLLKMPLVSYDQYETIHFIPVPIRVNETLAEIELRVKFMIVNLHRDTYYPITESELKSCRSTSQLNYMCNQVQPLYRRGSAVAACELSFVNLSIRENKCHLRPISEPQRWIPLTTPNHWIYCLNETSVVNVDCGNSRATISLNGSGILELPDGCSLKEETLTIQAHKIFPSSFKIRSIPIKNISHLALQTAQQEVAMPPLTHSSENKRIKQLQQQVQGLIKNELQPLTDQHQQAHQFAVGYSGLFLGAFVLICLVYQQLCRHRRKPTGLIKSAPTPAPRAIPTEARTVPTEEAFSLRLAN